MVCSIDSSTDLSFFFQGPKTIFDAVKANNVKELEAMVGAGVSVNEIDQKTDDKFTPLHWAAHSGSLEVCYL